MKTYSVQLTLGIYVIYSETGKANDHDEAVGAAIGAVESAARTIEKLAESIVKGGIGPQTPANNATYGGQLVVRIDP